MKTPFLIQISISIPLSLSALVRYQIWAGEQDKATLTPLDSHKATRGFESAKTLFMEKTLIGGQKY